MRSGLILCDTDGIRLPERAIDDARTNRQPYSDIVRLALSDALDGRLTADLIRIRAIVGDRSDWELMLFAIADEIIREWKGRKKDDLGAVADSVAGLITAIAPPRPPIGTVQRGRTGHPLSPHRAPAHRRAGVPVQRGRTGHPLSPVGPVQ